MATTVIPLDVDPFNFEQEVLRSPRPVLVEFWAGWCRSSEVMASVLRALAEDQQGAVKVVRVDVARHENLVERYSVRAVPTVLIFQRGAVREQVIGLTTESELREKLERCL